MTEEIESLDIWAVNKIIARECASINKDYLVCKKYEGARINACQKPGELVAACTAEVVQKVSTKYPTELSALVKCLDFNDYRFADCRSEEKALLSCWNADIKPPSK
mmetsp:Transcript_92530/g.181298  ORF Transcript_92530/g.181298 Transcript_92530/m.181298 type:complete len:106 (+) Transcript_92530:87-404(+)|eukprot:CAMPEP_0170392706 /NCGR_PEP_ID=MMETSP0117_2-20130122/20335_1 /TAXON_ID=400756 /ORGANISM="Durinskia baltica, Strain CSIRO CS-38" /LENGTH=105 /DNA_ID=CAMNT_0010648861 /DNA_START=70 /DNA_END=387 /DNA_ORIENTATION=+